MPALRHPDICGRPEKPTWSAWDALNGAVPSLSTAHNAASTFVPTCNCLKSLGIGQYTCRENAVEAQVGGYVRAEYSEFEQLIPCLRSADVLLLQATGSRIRNLKAWPILTPRRSHR